MNTSRKLTFTVAAGLLVTLGVGGAVAQVPTTSGVVHLCVQKSTGEVRVKKPAERKCKAGEIAFDVNQQGPVGATGASGPVGPAGLTGPTGPAGGEGSAGAAGATGPQGPAGPAGPTGAGLRFLGDVDTRAYVVGDLVRSDGKVWVAIADRPAAPFTPVPADDPGHWEMFATDGAAGATGQTGDQGLPGQAGPQGATGAAGPAGPAGASRRWSSRSYGDAWLRQGRQLHLLSMGETAEVIARCPPGKEAISGGFSAPDLRILGSYPTPLGDGWAAAATSEYVVPSASTLAVFAVCAFVP